MDFVTGILASLFFSAFLAATLLPGSSEAVLVTILATGSASTGMAVVVATVGNTLGSCVNWGIGRFFAHYRSHRWFPVTPDKFERYTAWYQRWGIWSLLLSWMPFVGDPITVIAGVTRTPFLLFTAIVLVAKGARYLAVAGVLKLIW